MHRLDALFRFSSVAVVGASEGSSYGSGPYRALQALGFPGSYVPVNPRRDQVHGVRAYPDVASLPADVDMAVVVVGRELVVPSLVAAADRGARAAVVISAGFVEADERGAELQAELSALARRRDILVVGPNCFGVASVIDRCAAFTGSGLENARTGNVAVLSNSGGLLNEVISYGNARGIGFSRLASTGNEAGVTGAEILDYYVEDPHTDVILAILEAVRDPALFVEVAGRAVAARKPIVALKLGASEKAAQSALTHTGALAGSDDVYSALFRQKGITRVADIDELVEMGALLSGAVPVLRRRPLERAAVIEISGGGKGLVCDAAERAGVGLPELAAETISALEAVLPAGTRVSNPLDTGLTWGGSSMDDFYARGLQALACDPSVDVVVSRFTVPRDGGIGSLRARVDELKAAREAHPDRLFAVLSRTADRFADEWASVVGDERLVFLQGYGRGLWALGRLAEYSRYLRRLDRGDNQRSDRPSGPRDPVALPDAAALDEVAAKAVLGAAGLPVVPTRLARTADEAAAQAQTFGFPVAAKVVSPQILHKSDSGGVRLGLADDGEVRAAFEALRQVAVRLPGAEFQGVAVQPMARPGVELMIGAHRDPQFGPVVLFGLGGVFVEVLHDVALRVAPLSRLDAETMLDEIRGRALLDGARGQPAVDRAAIADALVRLGDFMVTNPRVGSVDLNPVLGYQDGVLAIDARVVLS